MRLSQPSWRTQLPNTPWKEIILEKLRQRELATALRGLPLWHQGASVPRQQHRSASAPGPRKSPPAVLAMRRRTTSPSNACGPGRPPPPAAAVPGPLSAPPSPRGSGQGMAGLGPQAWEQTWSGTSGSTLPTPAPAA